MDKFKPVEIEEPKVEEEKPKDIKKETPIKDIKEIVDNLKVNYSEKDINAIKKLNNSLKILKENNLDTSLEESRLLLKEIFVLNILKNWIWVKWKEWVEDFIKLYNEINPSNTDMTQINDNFKKLEKDELYTIKDNNWKLEIYSWDLLITKMWATPLDDDFFDNPIGNNQLDEPDIAYLDEKMDSITESYNQDKEKNKNLKIIKSLINNLWLNEEHWEYSYLWHKIQIEDVLNFLWINEWINGSSIEEQNILIKSIVNNLKRSNYIKQFKDNFLEPIKEIEDKSKKEILKKLNTKWEISKEKIVEKIKELNKGLIMYLEKNYNTIYWTHHGEWSHSYDFEKNTTLSKEEYEFIYLFKKDTNKKYIENMLDEYNRPYGVWELEKKVPLVIISTLNELDNNFTFEDISSLLNDSKLNINNEYTEIIKDINKQILDAETKIEYSKKNEKINSYLDSLNWYDLWFDNVKLFTTSYDNRFIIEKDWWVWTYFTIPKYSEWGISNNKNLIYCHPDKSKEENNQQIINLIKRLK